MARCGLRGPARRARGPGGRVGVRKVYGRCAVRGAPRAPCAALARAHARAASAPARERGRPAARGRRGQSYQSRLTMRHGRTEHARGTAERRVLPRCDGCALRLEAVHPFLFRSLTYLLEYVYFLCAFC